MKKILIIAPHADDEILGCGGYILNEIKKKSEVKIVVATIGGEDKRQDIEERKKEFENVCSYVGASGEVLFYGYDAVIIVSKNSIDTCFLETVLGIEKCQSYKNTRTGKAMIIDVDKFRKQWEER